MADPTRNDAREPPAFHSERELIVLSRTGGVSRRAAPAPASPQELTGLLQSYGARMTPVFEVSPRTAVARTPRAAARAGARAPVAQLPNYYAVQVADDRKDELAEQLRNHPLVEAAFVKPAPEPPVRPPAAGGPSSRPMPPVPAASPTIADFTSRQGYLEKAPEGIDARRAWKRPGGRGADVNVIDIEGEWNFAHDDLIVNQGGMIGGSSANDLGWRNHGTAVAGEISADVNGFGCTGISPEAHIRAISVFGPSSGTAGAIRQAADALSPGDILLIELHFPGPRFNFAPRADQLGYIAAEWWPDNFAAITYATAVRGVIVVEAAGNGAEDLDAARYDTPAAGFPATWRNPFRLNNPQSGAIIVGAGAPPPGTHPNTDWGPDRSRLDFSNYGTRVDVQGWGREVTTTGYGDLTGGTENQWYTDVFSGTSSASPIVVGALACMQGALRAAGKPLLTPAKAQALLRATGSPQAAGPGRPVTQRIGNRPDLKAAFAALKLGPGRPKRKKPKSTRASRRGSTSRGSARGSRRTARK